VKKTATIAAAATLLALSLSACGDRDDDGGDDPSSAAPSESTSETTDTTSEAAEQYPDFKACMVSDSGGFDDKSFNETSLKGQTDAAEMFGVQTAQVESNSDTEYADNIDQLIADGCNEITTVGFLLGDATRAAAEKNPKVDFAIVDYAFTDAKTFEPNAPKNAKGLTFSTDEAAYLAGYLAAAESESGIVGTFGGLNIPTVTIFMEGFRLGVEKFNEDTGGDVKLLGWDGKDGSFTEDFDDKGKGQSVGADLIQQGADIIMPVAGPAGLGGLQAAKDADVRAIWVDTDGYESTEYGDILLTSVVKGLDVSVTEAIKESAAGTFTNELFDGTLANDGVGIAPYHDFDGEIDQEVKDAIDDLKAQIISGDITVGE
jgi:basic membrane protein A